MTPDDVRAILNLRIGAESQARVDALATKCNEGTLTPEERKEYEAYVEVNGLIAILQAKVRKRFGPTSLRFVVESVGGKRPDASSLARQGMTARWLPLASFRGNS